MDGSPYPESVQRIKSGPHLEKKLNAAFVRKAAPGRHSDGGGLYLKVDPSGARRWILRTVVRGRRRDYGLGSASLVSLAEAREKATELRRIARSGGNPKVKTREDEGKSITFKELAHLVYERKFKNSNNHPKHIVQWIRTLETYAFPTLGDLAVSEIHQDDIETVLDPIWTTKPPTASRVLQRISVVFDFACGRGYRTTGNPAAGILSTMRPQQQTAKHFPAIDYHDLPALMGKLKRQNVVGGLALRFTILTALRSGSVRHARWDQFDESLTEWTIPAELMKTRNEFVVPITLHAREVLLAAKELRTKASQLVFPSPSNPKKPISDNTMRKLLQTYVPNVTVHGMRAAFRTWAREDAAAPDDVAEMVLAHSVGSKTVQAYNRAMLVHERHKLLEQWGMWAMGELELYADPKTRAAEINRRTIQMFANDP
ncbi:MAG TPA: integrase arm-type DNA-binding domain-containing protein [Sulfitobacter pontiacus]|uniref:tyrosine-type recombinase/integrase n=1 Tax=Sulfitobacter pontiacus TaxID=60137 RepID=UPI002ABF7BA0|nr:integrase arm-type DNA-binding domain-containing protein [Sulfitobacter pontiacus]